MSLRVEDLPVAVIEIDTCRRIVAANPAASSLAGTPVDALLRQPIFDVLRPRSTSGADLLDGDWHPSARLRSVSRIIEQEVILRRGDGSEIAALVEGRYERDVTGELTGAILVLRRRDRGARKPRSGVAIVSAVSHELRSPLTSVRGYTALLLKRWDDIADTDRRAMLGQIDGDARRISRMIGELLDISRLETGRLQLNRVDLDVPRLAGDVLAKVEMAYPELEADLDFAGDFGHVDADPDKVEQVLINLIENACKYASPKGIEVRGRVENEMCAIEVCDRGKGIPKADMAHLFEQFFHSRDGRPSGTGLGLWISRGLIEAHGGEMTASSCTDPRAQTGTIFRFTLPRQFRHDAIDESMTDRRIDQAKETATAR